MRKSLVHCTELRLKLAAYFKHIFPDEKDVVPVKTRAELARALDVYDGQLKNWVDGRGDGREDHIPEWVLSWLTEQLLLVSKGRLNKEQAYDLWRNCLSREFARQLRDKPVTDFMVLLRRKQPTLTVEVGEPATDLPMFEEPFFPLPNEQILYVGDKVRFDVKVRAGRCLIVLASSPYAWYWMSPSDSHPGPTSSGSEVVPQASGFTIGVRGPHRVVAIELGSETPPYIRERGEPMDLEPHMVQALTEEILHCDLGSGWRWGETRFFVEKKLEIKSPSHPIL